jgi:hypothetical protein
MGARDVECDAHAIKKHKPRLCEQHPSHKYQGWLGDPGRIGPVTFYIKTASFFWRAF